MLTYIWFCVLLRAAVPGADHFIAHANTAVTQMIGAGIAEHMAPPAERRLFHITTERRGQRDVAVAMTR